MESTTAKQNISKSSEQRVKAFVDEFIRSEYVQGLASDRDSDFINRHERASRCWDAAEHGCDGKLHSEVIGDWRDALNYWVRDRRRGKFSNEPDRFTAAVEAHFDRIEQWHETNGSLWEQVG